MDFYSAYAQGFARIAACTVPVHLADPAANAVEIIERVVRELPVTNLYWWGIPPGMAPRETYESIELFARHVLARVHAFR